MAYGQGQASVKLAALEPLTYIQRLLMLPVLAVNLTVCAQDWRRITPLKTVRTEVESLFGSTSGVYDATYTLQDGILFVEYSSGPCTADRKGGWDVPENTVVSVRFVPKSKRRFASLKLDFTKFRKVVGKHVGGVAYYINDEAGITYEVQRDRVDAIEYLPGKSSWSLKCAG